MLGNLIKNIRQAKMRRAMEKGKIPHGRTNVEPQNSKKGTLSMSGEVSMKVIRRDGRVEVPKKKKRRLFRRKKK